MNSKLYGIHGAAKYLGISVAALKYHIHTSKTIAPARIGHSLVFTQDQLDQFKSNRRKPGRPRKGDSQQ